MIRGGVVGIGGGGEAEVFVSITSGVLGACVTCSITLSAVVDSVLV